MVFQRALAVLTLPLIVFISVAEAASEGTGTDPQLLSGDRVLLGTVEEVRSDQAESIPVRGSLVSFR